MEIYLIRHAQSEHPNAVTNPYSSKLTAEGREQAAHLAVQCHTWGIQFLCASTMTRAQQTADAIEAALPDILRWDLSELEDLTLDDLLGEPSAGQWVSTWTNRQLRLGRERAWTRVMSAWARIQVYAETHGLERIAIVAHLSTLSLLLLNWLGADWRALEHVSFDLEPGATAKVSLNGHAVCLDWMNRV